jgi:hypothetical protein
MLIGNLVAILFSGFVTTVIALMKPDNYDWQTTREIPMVDDSVTGVCPPSDSAASPLPAPHHGLLMSPRNFE